MAADVTLQLARFAAGLKYDEIPERVQEYCKILLLDALACAVAGHRGEETGQVTALAQALGASRESSVIGGDRLSMAGATLLNGYLITAVTMCDVHRPTITHITPEVVPAALAIAERDSFSGRDLLTALAAGCETTTRVGIGLDFQTFRARGFHGPGVIGPFGAAAAVGRLLGFDGDTMAAAFGLAGSQAAGTFAAWGTPTVKFHQCRGALSGLMAALLAQQGFKATRSFLTAQDGGLYNSYSNGGRPTAVGAELGKRWELEQIALRLWPSAAAIQGLITALFDLVEKHDLSLARTAKVHAAVSRVAFDMHGNFAEYKGKFQALLSAHYVTAAVLQDRALTLTQFELDRYTDPVLVHFAAERVEVTADDTLVGPQALVEAQTTDGKRLAVRCEDPLGAPKNPLSRAQVEGKFRTYAGALLSEAAIEEAVEIVAQLENLESTKRLMDVLRTG